MVCDQARAILGGMSEAAKNYVMGGKDRVMSWSHGVAQRLCIRWVSGHMPYAIFHMKYCIWHMAGDAFFSVDSGYGLSHISAMVSNAAATKDAAVRTWFQAIQLPT